LEEGESKLSESKVQISAAEVKELREKTGAGVMESKKALEESCGNMEKAAEILTRRGIAKAEKKASRTTNQGLVEAYIHGGGRIGSLIELNTETDFVARTPDFRELAHDIAMQVAATNPTYLRVEDIPAEVIEKEKAVFAETMKGKPAQILEKATEGRLAKFYGEVVLLNQPFIKDCDVTIQQLITQKIAKLGENIAVRRFARFQLGEGAEE
jgi:elongation factor Ts